MRLIYSLAWLLILPLAFLHLMVRSRRQPGYLRNWPERLGFARVPAGGAPIWLHAVSVGETRAATSLIRLLRQRHPELPILLTHTTPTGRDTGRDLFGGEVTQAYLPYDFPPLVAMFLHRAKPCTGIVLETEIWPNLYAGCAHRGVPLYLVNARLSARPARGYQRLAWLTRPALRALAGVAAQTAADAERLTALGARDVVVTGNLKFDVAAMSPAKPLVEAFRQRFHGRFVWLAASTRDGEEVLLLDALTSLDLPDLLLVIVPRHPQRFEDVAGLLRARGMRFARRSAAGPATDDTRVFLGDSMGELAAYYAAADLAYVGGSLLPFGGQNLIEAAAAGCPILIGPHTWNFAEAAEQAVARGAARRVADVAELARAVRELHADAAQRAAMSAAGTAFAAENRGATERVYALIAQTLAQCSARN
jgi:3-deoxy-D-manno-octulosonic-acid transferase